MGTHGYLRDPLGRGGKKQTLPNEEVGNRKHTPMFDLNDSDVVGKF